MMCDLATEFSRKGDGSRAGLPAAPAASAAYYSGEDALYQRVPRPLGALNGGLRPWQAPDGVRGVAALQALWCGTAVQPLADRAAKLARPRAGRPGRRRGTQITLAAAALVADDPRQAVRLRDQAEAVPRHAQRRGGPHGDHLGAA